MWLLVSAFAAGGSSQSPMVAPESRVFGRTENRALNRLLDGEGGPPRSVLL
jgi:hypothetical protein